jgi:hypothetical protein
MPTFNLPQERGGGVYPNLTAMFPGLGQGLFTALIPGNKFQHLFDIGENHET